MAPTLYIMDTQLISIITLHSSRTIRGDPGRETIIHEPEHVCTGSRQRNGLKGAYTIHFDCVPSALDASHR